MRRRLSCAILMVLTTLSVTGCPPDKSVRIPDPSDPGRRGPDQSSGQCVDPVGRGFPFLAEFCTLPDGRTGFIE